jgi:hypothetical protein
MKKLFLAVVMAVIMTFDGMGGAFAADAPNVSVINYTDSSGRFLAATTAVIRFDGGQPFIQNGTMYVPVRKFVETLGYSAAWQASAQRAVLSYDMRKNTVQAERAASFLSAQIKKRGYSLGNNVVGRDTFFAADAWLPLRQSQYAIGLRAGKNVVQCLAAEYGTQKTAVYFNRTISGGVRIVNGTLYAPLRELAEVLGYQVEWDAMWNEARVK